ncbi:hypothetical protein EV363DRAFT_1275333 [Boletus edulis]|nr:hypothetical protein EV363DRAFT_1275333 [Boletus edulis]
MIELYARLLVLSRYVNVGLFYLRQLLCANFDLAVHNNSLDDPRAPFCVLVETCTEAEYVKLIEALCAKHKVNLIRWSSCRVFLDHVLPLCATPLAATTPGQGRGW